MNYLVTGAAGFIGSCIARELIRQGHQVVTIDNLSTGKESAIPEGCHFVRGNAQDAELVNGLKGEGCEAIIREICSNLSAPVSVEYAAGTPGDQHGIYGDWSKIGHALGWRPEIDFATGMKKMVAWARNEIRQ